MTLKQICCILTMCLSSTGFAQKYEHSAVHAQANKQGILLLAYGGSIHGWNEEIHHVADLVDLSIPTEISFGVAMKASMQSAVDRLTARGVTQIVAVPLYISSHSSAIESIAYLLGQRTTVPEEIKDYARFELGGHGPNAKPVTAEQLAELEKPVQSKAAIRMTSALDHHRIVSDILTDRAASISASPAHEVVILIAHGPVSEEESKLWLADMQQISAQMKQQTHYADIVFLTLRDDAPAAVRDAATQELRQSVTSITGSGNRALVVPLLLSYGGIENSLRERLKGLQYEMPMQALLPDRRIANWVLESANATAQNSGELSSLR
jgi:sirohydrochlorin ferrochelatase